jgi:hypothetical protein
MKSCSTHRATHFSIDIHRKMEVAYVEAPTANRPF